METINNKWKSDNYTFVGKTFDLKMKNMLNTNSLLMVIGVNNTNSIDYELTGTGGYGKYTPYDGSTLVNANEKRGFKTVVTPKEWAAEAQIKYKQWRTDKLGETRKVGAKLATSGYATVQSELLKAFSNAFNPQIVGGDGKSVGSYRPPYCFKRR